MRRSCQIGPIRVGSDEPILLIGGPCVLEDSDTNRTIAQTLRDLCREVGFSFIFKASFDKANRSSFGSARGPGMHAGLAELAAIRDEIGVTITTDVHLPEQAEPVAEVADLLQVPAFLCRQTDLLAACAHTRRAVNVKKGQFVSPQEMRYVIEKLQLAGAREIMLTERGTFFGYHRLVNDFVGVGDMLELGPPVCFDVTHSTQLPGASAGSTGGRPERGALLARAAVAAGVDAVFLECHPRPAESSSDAATVQPLSAIEPMLRELAAIRRALQQR